MLVLSRKDGEQIVLGENGKTFTFTGEMIVTVDRQGNRTRVGIEAPREIPIRRGELESKDPEQESPTS